MTARLNLTGKKFGRMTVVGFLGTKGWKSYWKCVCICGKRKNVAGAQLNSGHTQSCGCARKKHGLTSSRIYSTWCQMLQRCENSKAFGFKWYGGRGISVCARWHKFKNFLDDMGERPENRTLDRINNDGNYEPGNCRWATNKEQARTAIKEYCLRGHKLSETEFWNRRGDRVCRECRKIRLREWCKKKKALNSAAASCAPLTGALPPVPDTHGIQVLRRSALENGCLYPGEQLGFRM